MTSQEIILKCLEQARIAGLSVHKQNQVATEVMRKLRPEWSDSQILDSINRTRNAAGC